MTSISRVCGKEDHISFRSWNFTNRNLKEGVVISAGVGRKHISLLGHIFLIFIFTREIEMMGSKEGGMSVASRLREHSYLSMVDATNIMNILKLEIYILLCNPTS